jgi:hypothetical protein
MTYHTVTSCLVMVHHVLNWDYRLTSICYFESLWLSIYWGVLLFVGFNNKNGFGYTVLHIRNKNYILCHSKIPVLHCSYIRKLQKTLHVKLDCVTALRWRSITGCAAIILLVCNSCCAQSGYHVYGLRSHLNSLYFTVSNSLTVCVPTAFVHVRTVTLSWFCLKPLAEGLPSSLLFHPHYKFVQPNYDF